MNSSRDRIRAGVIGAGFIGPAHIESLRRLGFVDVIAIAGRDGASTDRSARDLSIPRAYGDVEQLVRDPDVDVVEICSPNIHHFSQARAALDAGKHVVCEKPLAMTSGESAQLVDLAERSDRVHAVTFNIRFYPLVQQMRSLVRDGALGTIYQVHGGYWQDWLLHDTDYNWRVERGQGGALRAVGDIGSHWLDLAQYVTGMHVTRLCAQLSTFLPVRQKPSAAIQTFSSADIERRPVDVDTEDAAALMLAFDGGARGNMQVSQVSAGRKNRVVLEVNGSRGSVCWDGERPNELWIGHRDEPNEVLIKDPALLTPFARPYARYPGGHDEGFADSHTAIERAIYQYIRDGGRNSGREPDFPTFRDGHRENVLGDCILTSSREERWIEVPTV